MANGGKRKLIIPPGGKCHVRQTLQKAFCTCVLVLENGGRAEGESSGAVRLERAVGGWFCMDFVFYFLEPLFYGIIEGT